MGIDNEYRNSAQRGPGKIIRKYPKAYFPQLTTEDYTRGYIIRYFVKLKSNSDSIIYEVDKKEYEKFSGDNVISGRSFFVTISLRWKIKGKREDVIMGNTRTVESKEQNMPGIRLRLGNRLQFWKDL